MFTILNRDVFYKESKDHLVWGRDSKRVFFVKSAYVGQVNGSVNGDFSLLWKAKALPKALIIARRIFLDIIPTSYNLIRRGVVVNSSLCVLCSKSEEFTQHLFLDCVYA